MQPLVGVFSCRGMKNRLHVLFAGCIPVDDQDFAGFHIAHIRDVINVEGTGFTGHKPAVSLLAQRQWPEAVGVAHGDELVVGEDDQAVGSGDLGDSVYNLLDLTGFLAVRNQMEDELGVGGGLKQHAFLAEAVAQLPGVGQVAVVCQGQVAVAVVYAEGLDIGRIPGGAGGGVTVVADGCGSRGVSR